MSKIILDGILESIATRVDGSVRVTFGTQTIDPSYAANLFALRGQYCKALFSDTNVTPMEEKLINEEVIKDGRKIKTKSQKLRAIIYILYEQEKPEGIEFTDYYDGIMNKLIDHYKSKLD